MRQVVVQKEALFDVLLHQGMTTYKRVNSKALLKAQVEAAKQDKQSKKGAVFVVRQKSDFTDHGVKGYIITSKETLLDQTDELSHFTPNIYRMYTYKDTARRYIQGFEERNLLQINTFVVDIDTKCHTVNDLLLACMDDSIGLPTFIVESDRGYQLYFVLSSPLFISNKADFRGLKVAKRISDNLKRSLLTVDADIYCNDFGFFRVPTAKNIAYIDLQNTYTMHELIQWSIRRDDDISRPLFVVPTSNAKKASILESEWFQALIRAVDIKGKKGQMGRDNTLFTLALACFQEGWSKDRTMDFLDEFNSRLTYPLSGATVNKVLHSAYSGKYHGPAKEYVEELLATYVPHRSFDVQLGSKCWYKHKKAREDRERSHTHEWEQDLITWMTAEKSVSEPFIWCTQKEICEAINIPSSTLNKLLKESTKIIKTTTGKGRHAKTGLTTVELYIQYVIHLKQTQGARVAESLRQLVKEQMGIMAPSASYTTLATYMQKVLKEPQLTAQIALAETLVNTG